MGRSFRLPAQISLVVALGALLVAFGVTLLLTNTVKLHHGAEATARSDAYLVSVVDVERLVVDAETGLRGYVLTERSMFLAPTRAAQAGFPRVQGAMRQAAARDGAFGAQASALARKAESYLGDYVPAVERLVRQDPRRARSFAITLQGKNLVDSVRAAAARLERLVQQREQNRQRTAAAEAGHATTEAIVVLVLLTVLTLLLGAFLGRLVISRERARSQSEVTTRTLRQSLLPSEIPVIPDCELAARFIPARADELVGGDFYDVFRVGTGQWAIVVGDVCGKGADAAAVTAMARWTLRSLAATPVAPSDALRFLNGAMLNLDLNGRFITIAYLLLTLDGDGAHVSLACAGHPPGILVPAVGEPSVLSASGTLLGVWPDITLNACDIDLAQGDSVVLYTDGVSDPGPGPARLPVQALSDRPPGASAEQLAGALQAYAGEPDGPQRDDIAILALRIVDRRRDQQGSAGGAQVKLPRLVGPVLAPTAK
jgi:serine phosphatase RsbU (regulator of sigma subunit)